MAAMPKGEGAPPSGPYERKHESGDHYQVVRLRRADVRRLQAEVKRLGGMYLTDVFHVISYMTAEEISHMSGTAAERKMREWQARDDAGETPRIRPDELRGDDADEARINKQNTAPGDKESDK